MPVVLVAFGRFALLAPLVNLVAVPLVPPAMAAGTVALLAGAASSSGLPGQVGVILALPAWALLTVLIGIVDAAAALPFASIALRPPVNLVAGALAAGLVLLGVTPSGRAAVSALVRRTRPRLADSRPSNPAPERPRPGPGRRRHGRPHPIAGLDVLPSHWLRPWPDSS